MPTTLTLTTNDGEMDLYEAEPRGSAGAAVVVIQEAFGVNDHIEDVTRRFAAAGYRAVAPHFFYRTGDPVLDYGNIDKVMPHIEPLTQEGFRNDLETVFAHLSSLGFSKKHTGTVGFCMGGTVSFLAAANYELGAAVTFYGGGVAQGRFGMPSLIDLASALKTPWLGLYGDLDQGIPVDQVESLHEALSKSPVPAEIVRYEEAGHGFHCDARESYHEASARDAWRRTLAWFEKYLSAADG